MTQYKFSYKQLSEEYHSQCLGHLGPKFIRMAPKTYTQFKVWVCAQSWSAKLDLNNLSFHGALVQVDYDIPDGKICFVGGAHVLDLESE